MEPTTPAAGYIEAEDDECMCDMCEHVMFGGDPFWVHKPFTEVTACICAECQGLIELNDE